MSLNPDSLVRTTRAVLDLEMRLAQAEEPVLPEPHPA